ncbi:ABC transporter substrate-binding protein [Cetobacterium sp.]|uniref:ABC transporter substrate-binding protein n=1 Tax=Cetobacterium sp. TaxID=2071632 RepID=UPI003AEF793F
MKNVWFIFTICLSLFSINTFGMKDNQFKDTLIIAQRADVKTLDPQKSIDTISNKVINLMFESLLTLDENLTVVPQLATSWEQVDNLNTVFHLRKDVTFHNGEPLTSEDVVFSLNRARSSAQVGYNFTPIIDIKAIDKYTVQVTTDKPFGAILKYLSSVGGSIVSKKAVEESGNAFSQNPIGSGPYKFKEWIPGDKIVVEAFVNYHGEIPKNKTLIVRSIPEVTNRTIALETGEVDIAFDIGIMDRETVKESGDLELLEVEAPSTLYLGFDNTNPLFQNKKLREAIAYAIDNESLAEFVFRGAALSGDSPIPPVIDVYNPNVKKYAQNIPLAKELMKEAGFENGLNIELWTSAQSTWIDMCTIIQDQLKEIGILAEIKIFEWSTYVTVTSQPNKALYLLSWNVTSVDGDPALYPLFHSNEKGMSGNRSFYENKEIDSILLEARTTIDQDKRKSLYFKAQEIIQNELPHYTLVYPHYNLGARKAVKNLILQKNGYTDLAKTYVLK